MMRLTPRILSCFIPPGAKLESPSVRLKAGLLEGWVSVIVNTLLFLFKGSLGLMTGSVSLLADAAHTLADSLTSVVVIFGFRVAEKPADERHPFGHGRMEGIAAVVIAVLLAVVAFEMLVAALKRLISPVPVHAPDWVIVALVGTIVIKELLARFSFDLGKMFKSQALIADGWHHRSDVLATGLVVVAFVGVHWNLSRLDGAMGIGVSIMIVWAAFETLRGSMGPLLGERAPEEMYQEIEQIARSVPGVLGVHDILVNRYGGMDIISLHIEVSATESAMRLHEMSDEIELKVVQRFTGHAIVHVDPLNTNHAHYEEVRRIVSEAVSENAGALSFHDLRLLGGKNRFKVVFDVAPKPGPGALSVQELQFKVGQRLREKFPRAHVVIDVEPLYFRNVAENQGRPTKEMPGQSVSETKNGG